MLRTHHRAASCWGLLKILCGWLLFLWPSFVQTSFVQTCRQRWGGGVRAKIMGNLSSNNGSADDKITWKYKLVLFVLSYFSIISTCITCTVWVMWTKFQAGTKFIGSIVTLSSTAMKKPSFFKPPLHFFCNPFSSGCIFFLLYVVK